MKIVRFHEYGGPEVLKVEEVPEPVPGPGEVRVRAEAIGVGIPDILVRTNTDVKLWSLPMIPGNEIAGRIDAVGDGVERFKQGDHVYVTSREMPQRGGGYAEARVVPAEAPFHLPETITAQQAVSLGNYQLGWMLLNHAATPQPGQSILVHAAAGGVGSALVQLAKQQGLTAYGIAGGAEKADYVRKLGADAVIDRLTENLTDRVTELTGGAGLHVIYDSVAGPRFTDNFSMLRQRGRVVLFGFLAGLPEADIYQAIAGDFTKCLSLQVFSVHCFDDEPDIRRRSMEQAITTIAEGTIQPHIHASFKLEDAADAHRLLESGSVTGKVILTA